MKVLKLLALVILGLMTAFLALGAVAPAIQYDSSAVIDKPATEVWQVMGDEAKAGQWLAGYLRSELVSGEPRTVGAVSKIYFEEDGSEMVIEETITAVDANRRMAMRFASDFMNMDYEIAMRDAGGKTEVTSSTTATGNGIVASAVMLFFKGSMIEQEETNLRSLKRVVEANTDVYPPSPKP